jgi:hypothetical protein
MKREFSFGRFQVVRSRPFLSASVALHLALALALYMAGPYRVAGQQQAKDQSRISAALESARREQMQRHLSRVERLERALVADSAPLPPAASSKPADQVARAKALTERIEAAEQRKRAAELARLLKIAPKEALAKLKAEAAKRPPPALPPDPNQALAQLDQRARAAAQRQLERERQHGEGHTVAQAGNAGKGQGQGPKGSNPGENNEAVQKPHSHEASWLV